MSAVAVPIIQHLLEQLRWRLRKHEWTVQTTADLGLSPTWVEALPLPGWLCAL